MPRSSPTPGYRLAPITDGSLSLDQGTEARLRDASAYGNVFSTLPWFLHLAKTTAQPPAAAGLLHSTGNEGGCVPILRSGGGAGRRLEALSNFYTPEFAPVTTRSDIRMLTAAVAGCARDEGVDVVDFRPLDTESDFYLGLQDALREAGFKTDTYFCFGNWHAEVPAGRFESYFQERPSQLRNTWRRNRKKLEKIGLEVEILQSCSPSLERAIGDYEAIYNLSWKQPEPYPAFIPGLIRMAAEHGWLRLGVVRVEGRAVASQIWFVKDGVASIFKLAYVEDYGKLSVGTILTHELMRHCIDEDRVTVVDYLSGDDAYKKDWMTHRRERRGIVAFNPRRAAGLALAARHFGGRWLQRIRARKAAPSRKEAAPLSDNAAG